MRTKRIFHFRSTIKRSCSVHWQKPPNPPLQRTLNDGTRLESAQRFEDWRRSTLYFTMAQLLVHGQSLRGSRATRSVWPPHNKRMQRTRQTVTHFCEARNARQFAARDARRSAHGDSHA
jgi:hypothetical protein